LACRDFEHRRFRATVSCVTGKLNEMYWATMICTERDFLSQELDWRLSSAPFSHSALYQMSHEIS
jgi:hypothetical protein